MEMKYYLEPLILQKLVIDTIGLYSTKKYY